MIRLLSSLAVLAAAGTTLFSAGFPDPAALPIQAGLPDPLVMLDGTPVKTAAQWNKKRRPELKALFQHYMYGTLPPAPKNLRSTLEREDQNYFNGRAVKRQITLTFGPVGTPPLNLLLITPTHVKGKIPVFVALNFCGNHALLNDPEIPITSTWMYPSCAGCENNRATERSRGGQAKDWPIEEMIERGYGIAAIHNGDLDPDIPDFSDGVHKAYRPPGVEPTPTEWGSVAAWAWGAMRVVDYLETDSRIDRKKIAVVGHSRLGKASIVAGAFDERISLVIPHQAGCGGTAPSRGKIGESVKQINDRFPHWFNDVFTRFNDEPERLPFDQNGLVALVAPRAILFSNAQEDQWANPKGQFEVLKGAQRVYRLLNTEGLAVESMPQHGQLVASKMGYYIRAGKHSMHAEDWKIFMDYADAQWAKE